MLETEFPPALRRLEADLLSLTQLQEGLSQGPRAMNGLTDRVETRLIQVLAQAEARLERSSERHEKLLTAYSRGVTLLLLSQAVLIAVTVLMLWTRR